MEKTRDSSQWREEEYDNYMIDCEDYSKFQYFIIRRRAVKNIRVKIE